MKSTLLTLLLALFVLFIAGCSDDDNPVDPGPTSTTYVGVFAGAGISGTINISVANPKMMYTSVPADTGDTLVVTALIDLNGGGTVSLTGIYVVATGQITFGGGGYTFTGTLTGDSISGTFTFPGGSGVFSADEGTSANTKTFCGRYQANAPDTDAGAFNMTIRGTDILVIVYPDDAGGASFSTTGTLNASTNEISILNPENPAIVVATGTYNPSTNTVSGVYFGDPGGTWSGSLCN